MHAVQLLHKHLKFTCPNIHSKRLESLMCATQTLSEAQQLSITSLGRALKSQTSAKHNIKRMDRLVGNVWLRSERELIYSSITRWLLRGQKCPLILVDWSELTTDRHHFLLRAAIPMGGRSLTLYEEVHPIHRYGHRQVHRNFLNALHALLPEGVKPIMVTDAGFRSTWLADVEAVGWHWVGRIRNRDFVWFEHENEWKSSKILHQIATARPKALGAAQLVHYRPLACHLFIYRKPKQGRTTRALSNKTLRGGREQKVIRRAREPWLIATSDTLGMLTAKQVMSIYRKRMQIEEGFRDIKCERYGLGLSSSMTQTPARMEVLLLIGLLALFLLWLIGAAAKIQQYQLRYQSNTTKNKQVLSTLFLGMLVMRKEPKMILYRDVKNIMKKVPNIIQCQHFP